MSLQDELRVLQRGSAERRRRRPRLDLVVFWCVLLGPALALAAWGAARQRVGDLEERLVRDATRVYGATHPRPVHVDAALAGTIGDAVVRHLPPIEAEAKRTEKDQAGRKALRAVVAGESPASAVPVGYLVALARLGPDLDGLLAGARSARADFAGSSAAYSPMEGASWSGVQLAALLAGVRVRLAIAAGEPESALVDCLDALGLGRDAAIWGGLVGSMVGAAIVAPLAPACGAALDALPAGRLPDAIRRIRTIRDAFPPFSVTLREEAVASQLFPAALPDHVRAHLPARARAVAAEAADKAKDVGWVERLLVRDGWRSGSAALDALVAAADLPDPERKAAFDDVRATLDRRLAFMAGVLLPVNAYLKYARRMENVRRRFDALVVAGAARRFRVERGAWPRGLADLRQAALVDDAEDVRSHARLEEDHRGALFIRAPLLEAYPDDAQGITLHVSATPGGAARPRAARPQAAERP